MPGAEALCGSVHRAQALAGSIGCTEQDKEANAGPMDDSGCSHKNVTTSSSNRRLALVLSEHHLRGNVSRVPRGRIGFRFSGSCARRRLWKGY